MSCRAPQWPPGGHINSSALNQARKKKKVVIYCGWEVWARDHTHTHTVACFGHVTVLFCCTACEACGQSTHLLCSVLYLACHIVIGVASPQLAATMQLRLQDGNTVRSGFAEKHAKYCAKVTPFWWLRRIVHWFMLKISHWGSISWLVQYHGKVQYSIQLS